MAIFSEVNQRTSDVSRLPKILLFGSSLLALSTLSGAAIQNIGNHRLEDVNQSLYVDETVAINSAADDEGLVTLGEDLETGSIVALVGLGTVVGGFRRRDDL